MATTPLRACAWCCALSAASAHQVDEKLLNESFRQDREAVQSKRFVAVFSVQLVLGVLMVSYGCLSRLVSRRWLCKAAKQAEVEQTESDSDRSSDGEEDDAATRTRRSLVLAASMVENHGMQGGLAFSLDEHRRHLQWQRMWREAFVDKKCIFCSHSRSVENFVRDSDDPAIRFPPTSPMEIESPYYGRLALYSFFWNGATGKLLLRSVGWSLLSGSLGTYLSGCRHSLGDVEWIDEWKDPLSDFLSDVKWLPTFMLAGHLAFYVQRWRQFMFAAWGAEGRLKDLGIVIGSDVSDPGDPHSRRVVFKIYRFMVLAMALQYKAILPPLQGAVEPLLLNLQRMGLLMPEEVAVLRPHGSTRMRDAVLSWIAVVVRANGPARTGVFRGNSEYAVLQRLTELRAKFMYFHGNNFYPQPNVYAAFMTCLVDMYCAFMILAYPFKMEVHIRATPLYGFQPLTILTVSFMTQCFWGALELTRRLAHPFKNSQDSFNIDALIAGTEQTLFTSLRAAFDSPRYLDHKLD